MFVKTSILVMLSFALISGEPPAPQYGAPFNNVPANGYDYNHGNNYDNGHSNRNGHDNGNDYNNGNSYGNGNGHNHDHAEPKAYEFGYQVRDDYTGNNYKRQEKSDGNQVTGEYRVQLPDGRMQIVTYYADWQTGYHADVKYEGEAQYPDQYDNNNRYNQYNNNQENQYNNNQENQYDNQNYNGYDYNTPAATSQVSIKGLSNSNQNSGYNLNAINDGLSYNNNNYNRNHGSP